MITINELNNILNEIEANKASFNSMQLDDRFINLSEKNKKLVPSEAVKFLIWTLPAVKTCPFRTTACEADCYALKAEHVYTSARLAREYHFKLSKRDNFVESMVFTIGANMARKSYKNAERVYFRIHESGDFYNYFYFAKFMQICKACKRFENLYFVIYTKSLPYIEQYINDGGIIPENVAIMASVWADTKPELIKLGQRLGLPVYSADTADAVEEAIKNASNFKCECKDCGTCRACFHKQYKRIYCVIH